MKNDRNGKAAVLTRAQMDELFSVLPPKYRLLFGICRFTGCRIREALQLQRSDIGQDSILFRRATTKTKMTREVPIAPELAQLLSEAQLPQSGYVFPGKLQGHLTSQAADLTLRAACDYVGFKGVSTHSFRRSALTHMANNGVPLHVIQTISGHASLAVLREYLEVSEEQKRKAIAVLGL